MFEAGSCQIPLHYSWFGASSELAPNMFGASSELTPNMFGTSSELASVMEFGFYLSFRCTVTVYLVSGFQFYHYWFGRGFYGLRLSPRMQPQCLRGPQNM